jgi:hypothetical protein
MNNIHVIPTNNPSDLYIDKGFWYFNKNFNKIPLLRINQNIYITNSEEIKDGEYGIHPITLNISKHHSKDNNLAQGWKKIILTTDQKLIDDGIQSIDDDFLNWFVKNPNCEWVEVDKQKEILGEVAGTTYIDVKYKIIIPKEEPNYNMKEEILDEMKRLEKQKQHLIDMMEADEELGLYNDDKPDTPEETAAKEYLLRVNTKVHKDLMRDGYLKVGFVEGFRKSQKISYNDSLDLFISEIKKEFNDTDWEYLDFIKNRIMENKFKKK